MNWISVKERLPEKGYGWYLCYILYPDASYYIEIMWYNADAIRGWWHGYVGKTHGAPEQYVTHWQPLPEPPEVDHGLD